MLIIITVNMPQTSLVLLIYAPTHYRHSLRSAKPPPAQEGSDATPQPPAPQNCLLERGKANLSLGLCERASPLRTCRRSGHAGQMAAAYARVSRPPDGSRLRFNLTQGRARTRKSKPMPDANERSQPPRISIGRPGPAPATRKPKAP